VTLSSGSEAAQAAPALPTIQESLCYLTAKEMELTCEIYVTANVSIHTHALYDTRYNILKTQNFTINNINVQVTKLKLQPFEKQAPSIIKYFKGVQNEEILQDLQTVMCVHTVLY